ncbi:MAG: DUF3303 family protein [Gemmatimonadaceae bacterium]
MSHSPQLYMVIETFRNGQARPIYERFKARGRLAPDGLRYVVSWVDESLGRCWQVMETDRRELLDQWMAAWNDLTDFEVIPVLSSADAAAKVLGASGGA